MKKLGMMFNITVLCLLLGVYFNVVMSATLSSIVFGVIIAYSVCVAFKFCYNMFLYLAMFNLDSLVHVKDQKEKLKNDVKINFERYLESNKSGIFDVLNKLILFVVIGLTILINFNMLWITGSVMIASLFIRGMTYNKCLSSWKRF